MSRKSKFNWSEVQAFYDSGKSPTECCRNFGIDKSTFWLASQQGRLKKDPLRARKQFDPNINILGVKFNDLLVLSRADYVSGFGVQWMCECVCGKNTVCTTNQLLTGNKKSCGCRRKRSCHRHHHWSGYEDISGEFWGAIKASCRTRARGRIIPFEITMEFAWDLYLKQDKKCALSGVPILICPNREDRTASLDRISSSEGYLDDNVQWTHWMVNRMKADVPQGKFLEWVKLIHENGKRID